MPNRHSLHKIHLEELKTWLLQDLWIIEPAKGEFEVLRARKSGGRRMIILYDRLESKEHYTIRDKDWPVIAAFLRDRKRQESL